MTNALLQIPLGQIDRDWLIALIDGLEDARGTTESPWVELKEKRQGNNIAYAVAALANAEGGLVIVGIVDDSDARGRRGVDRIIGVPKGEYEATTSSLRSSLGEAAPEIHPVGLPDPDRLVLVLRVDSDAVEHPVVVGGRVKVRVGSVSVDADRSNILRLAARDSQPDAAGPFTIYRPPLNAESLPFWDDDYHSAITVRVVGSTTLPIGILDRPWMPTANIDAVKGVLNNSRLEGGRLWMMGALAERSLIAPRGWALMTRHAGDIRFRMEPATSGRWPDEQMGGGTFVALDGRSLGVVIAATLPQAASARALSVEETFILILTLLVTAQSVTDAVIDSMGLGGPTRRGHWTGWLQPGDAHGPIDQLIRLDDWQRATTGSAGTQLLPPYRPPDDRPDALGRLVREWLLILLADNGVLNHEQEVEDLQVPEWLSDGTPDVRAPTK